MMDVVLTGGDIVGDAEIGPHSSFESVCNSSPHSMSSLYEAWLKSNTGFELNHVCKPVISSCTSEASLAEMVPKNMTAPSTFLLQKELVIATE